MFDAVIFDCDGVLADSEKLSVRGERAALAELGFDVPPADYVARYCGMHDAGFFAEVAADYEAATGRAAPADLAERVLEGRRREAHALQAVAGAAEAMRAGREAVGAIAVASSSRAHFLESKLKRIDLWDHAAPHIYSADLVAAGKPAPDIFIYAAQKLGAAPERCLVLEDSVNGVLAGLAAGMVVWGFTGGGHCFAGHGDRLARAGAGLILETHAEVAVRLRGGDF